MSDSMPKTKGPIKGKGPEFVRYFPHILAALKSLGNSGTPDEVYKYISESLNLSDDYLAQTNKNGMSKFENRVAWARFYLARGGYIDSSRRGVWALTDKSLGTDMSPEVALQIFKDVRKTFKRDLGSTADSEDVEIDDDAPTGSVLDSAKNHREVLVDILRSLPSYGFENFSQRLLREANFSEVFVTKKSGDGGIDGHGILKINPMLSIKVLFQCKRYSDPVGVSHIREFQAAIQGRADKGIFIATSTFTNEAKKEASRDGAIQIQLIDIDRLLELIEQLELGVARRVAYDVDVKFFDQFRTS